MKHYQSKIAFRNRTARGSVILLAAAFMVVLVIVFALMAMFVANSGTTAYYRDKIHALTRQALAAYVGRLSWSGGYIPGSSQSAAATEISNEVNSAVSIMGLPPANVTCVVNGQIASVTISIQGLALINAPTIMPASINMSDTMQMDLGLPPNGLLGLQVPTAPGKPEVYLPVYGRFVSPYSNGQTTLVSAPPCVATFYNAVQPYNQFSLQVLAGDAYSDSCP
jgi:hypothetical protein